MGIELDWLAISQYRVASVGDCQVCSCPVLKIVTFGRGQFLILRNVAKVNGVT